MKRNKSVINSLTLLTVLLFGLMSLASSGTSSGTNKTSTISNGEGQAADSEIISELVGTYYGVNESILVLFPNGEADYYFMDSYTEVNHDNAWSYDSATGKLTVNMKKSSFLSSYDVEAYLNDDVSEFNLVASSGTMNDLNWDDEYYYKYDENYGNFTVEQCNEKIADFRENHPDLVKATPTPKPKPTNTPVPTKKPISTTTTTVNQESRFEIPAFINYAGKYDFMIDTEYLDSLPFYEAKSGYEYLFVAVRCTNNSSSGSFYISSLSFQCYADNLLCEDIVIISDEIESGADVASGRSADIGFAYLVPKDAKSIELEFSPDWLSYDKAIIVVK